MVEPILFNHCVLSQRVTICGSFIMHVREEFFCKQGGGGPVFFPIVKGGDQYFFTHAKGGGPEKIDDRPSQIDGPPLPLKNDSSLRGHPGVQKHYKSHLNDTYHTNVLCWS